MRLAHAFHSRPTYGQHREKIREAASHMFRRAPEALVGDDWHVGMGQFQNIWKRAAHLLCATIQGKIGIAIVSLMHLTGLGKPL